MAHWTIESALLFVPHAAFYNSVNAFQSVKVGKRVTRNHDHIRKFTYLNGS
jgi:hypothetical protein